MKADFLGTITRALNRLEPNQHGPTLASFDRRIRIEFVKTPSGNFRANVLWERSDGPCQMWMDLHELDRFVEEEVHGVPPKDHDA
jgi:hypothetical protein